MKIQVGAQLCWTCKKACGGCSWSRKFEPVPGWEATPSVIYHGSGRQNNRRDIHTYHITGCPQFADG